jgi:hypothetical protein
MKTRLVAVSLLLVSPGAFCGVPAEPIAKPGALLFADDFAAATEEWKAVVPSFEVTDGTLRVWQARDDHGAVCRVHRPMKDVVVSFRFKLDGSTGFNAVFDDKNHKGSHAGHICRVAFAPKQIRLGDDREGVMRNDIFEMRKDPARKAEADRLLAGRGSVSNFAITPDAWHEVVIELSGDRMRVVVDGTPAAFLQSSGLAHETKQSFHFTVNGPGVRFDDVRIHAAE